MTKDEIIRMAWKTGLVIDGIFSGNDDLFAFANLIAAHKTEVALAEAYRCGYEAGAVEEREACAKWLDFYDGPNGRRAEAIRERGTT